MPPFEFQYLGNSRPLPHGYGLLDQIFQSPAPLVSNLKQNYILFSEVFTFHLADESAYWRSMFSGCSVLMLKLEFALDVLCSQTYVDWFEL